MRTSLNDAHMNATAITLKTKKVSKRGGSNPQRLGISHTVCRALTNAEAHACEHKAVLTARNDVVQLFAHYYSSV